MRKGNRKNHPSQPDSTRTEDIRESPPINSISCGIVSRMVSKSREKEKNKGRNVQDYFCGGSANSTSCSVLFALSRPLSDAVSDQFFGESVGFQSLTVSMSFSTCTCMSVMTCISLASSEPCDRLVVFITKLSLVRGALLPPLLPYVAFCGRED